MALEMYRYRDPAEIVERDELNALRSRSGCASCALRGDRVFDRYLCSVSGRQPGKRGFCRAWEALDTLGEAA
jgi:hypothetical protein